MALIADVKVVCVAESRQVCRVLPHGLLLVLVLLVLGPMAERKHECSLVRVISVLLGLPCHGCEPPESTPLVTFDECEGGSWQAVIRSVVEVLGSEAMLAPSVEEVEGLDGAAEPAEERGEG